MNKIKFICLADRFIFTIFLLLLPAIIISSSRANIQTDSIDYYSILQKLTDNTKSPIVKNLHFVEQRSPGYSIISMIPYYFVTHAIEPFVTTEKIIDDKAKLSKPPQTPPPFGQKETNNKVSEKMEIPAAPLFAHYIFFKNFYLGKEGVVFEWKTIFSLLFTSFALLFTGILFNIKTLMLEKRKIIGISLPMIIIFTSLIFMHNIINTPAYATLAAFGLSSIFCYFFVKNFMKERTLSQLLAGLFLGLLVLTRFEAVLIASTVALFLIFYKKWNFFKNLILGSLPSLLILLFYNHSQFGTPFYFGILKGDINQLDFNINYITANLINLQSVIVFWSFLISLGLLGLFFDSKKHLKALGVASLILIILLLIRVPVMYNCVGGDLLNIGGVPVFCPQNIDQALTLIRSDANRYITVLAPFAILGLQNLFIIFGKNLKR